MQECAQFGFPFSFREKNNYLHFVCNILPTLYMKSKPENIKLFHFLAFKGLMLEKAC